MNTDLDTLVSWWDPIKLSMLKSLDILMCHEIFEEYKKVLLLIWYFIQLTKAYKKHSFNRKPCNLGNVITIPRGMGFIKEKMFFGSIDDNSFERMGYTIKPLNLST